MDLLDIISELEATEFGRSAKTKVFDPTRKKNEKKTGQSSKGGKGDKSTGSSKSEGSKEEKKQSKASKSSKSSKGGSSDESLKTKVYSSKTESIVHGDSKSAKGSKQSKRRRI